METHDWRGVSFIGKHLRLESGMPKGLFFFISPLPGEISFEPSLSYKIKIIKFMGTDDINGIKTYVNLENFPDKDYDHNDITYMEEFKNVMYLTLFGPNAINIVQLGDVPFGAWNPVENSPIEIKNNKSLLQLTEVFKGDKPDSYGVKGDVESVSNPFRESPAIDLIGKPILIWMSNENVSVCINGEKSVSTSNENNNDLKEYMAIVLEPSFAVRATCFGFSNDDIDISNYTEGLMSYEKPKTTLKMFVSYDENDEDIILNAKEYLEGINYLVAEDIEFAGYIQDNKKNSYEMAKMVFKYPLLPEKLGFSLWGNVPELQINGAKGAIVLDSSTVSIGAPSSLRISGISDFLTNYGFISFSPHGETEFKSSFGSIFLNENSVYSNWDKWQKEIIVSLGIITIAGFLAGIVALIHKK